MADSVLLIAQALGGEGSMIPLPRSRRASFASSKSSRSRRSSKGSRASSVSSRSSLNSLKNASKKAAAGQKSSSRTTDWGTGFEAEALARMKAKTKLVVARRPKNEKYKPPPKGTFRSSNAPLLRSEALFQIFSSSSSSASRSKAPSPMPMSAGTQPPPRAQGVDSQDLSSMLTNVGQPSLPVAPKQSSIDGWLVPKSPCGAMTEAQIKAIQDLRMLQQEMPPLSVSEFDLFASARFRRDPWVCRPSDYLSFPSSPFFLLPMPYHIVMVFPRICHSGQCAGLLTFFLPFVTNRSARQAPSGFAVRKHLRRPRCAGG